MQTKPALFSAFALMAQIANANLHFAFSAGNFNTISTEGGSGTAGHLSSFALGKDDGTVLWESAYINDHSPCFNTNPASRIEVLSDCWNGPITLNCKSDGGGVPDKCSADYVGNHFDGTSDSDTTFIGIAISMEGSCQGEAVVDVSECTKENANIRFNYPTQR